MDKTMAALDACLYTIGIGIVLLIGYALRSGKFERSSGKAKSRGLSSLFGSIGEQPAHVESPSASSLTPDLRQSPSWWTDERIFELESRAIFSKTWLFVTHASLFQKPGDYKTFEISGFSFVVILGKDKKLRAFHNVCRHRAYAVTKKESGSSTVLGCRYHGWSYDTRGKLIKAPEFDKVPGFNMDLNGLWEVETEIRESMVFVNLNARGEVSRLSLFEGESRLKKWKIARMQHLEDWKVEGAFNWKLLGALARKRTEKQLLGAWIPGFLTSNQDDVEIGHAAIVRKIGLGVLLVLKAIPRSAKSTTVECSIFAIDPHSVLEITELKRAISWEIKQLAIKQQRILRNQEPILSLASSVANQGEINTLLGQHLEAERKLGSEIHPAARDRSFSREGKADDDFCRELESPGKSMCSANAKGLLDW